MPRTNGNDMCLYRSSQEAKIANNIQYFVPDKFIFKPKRLFGHDLIAFYDNGTVQATAPNFT